MASMVPGRIVGGASELDLAEQKSWQNYLAAALRMNAALNRRLNDTHGLSLSDVQLLGLLDGCAASGLQMGDLAEALPSPPSRLTRQVRRLEKQELVLRTASLHDRRRVMASITELGQSLLQKAMITYEDEVRAHFLGPLTRPQVAAMATSCRQIRGGLKRSN